MRKNGRALCADGDVPKVLVVVVFPAHRADAEGEHRGEKVIQQRNERI